MVSFRRMAVINTEETRHKKKLSQGIHLLPHFYFFVLFSEAVRGTVFEKIKWTDKATSPTFERSISRTAKLSCNHKNSTYILNTRGKGTMVHRRVPMFIENVVIFIYSVCSCFCKCSEVNDNSRGQLCPLKWIPVVLLQNFSSVPPSLSAECMTG